MREHSLSFLFMLSVLVCTCSQVFHAVCTMSDFSPLSLSLAVREWDASCGRRNAGSNSKLVQSWSASGTGEQGGWSFGNQLSVG